MEELLFGLTPAEWWAWSYLLFLAEKQGSTHVILPRPGEDLKAEAIYSRKHLKRSLKGLKAKFHLTNLIMPRSKARQIEVLLPSSKIGDKGVPNMKLSDTGVPNKGATGAPVSPITPLGTQESSIDQVISMTFPDSPPSLAKLKESLKRLLKLKQQELVGEIMQLSAGEIYQMVTALRTLCRYEPKGKGISEAAKLYAKCRFVQEAASVEKPEAWITVVAKRGQDAILGCIRGVGVPRGLSIAGYESDMLRRKAK